MVHSVYFRSSMRYGLIFWENFTNSTNICNIQKNKIRIVTERRCRDSCRDLLKNLNILPLRWKHLLFLIYNKDKLKLIYDVCNMNTRQRYNFQLPSSNLSLYHKWVYFTGIKVFTNLPQNIHVHSFYSINEYFNVKKE